MAFQPPSFSILWVRTRNVDSRFSTLLGRYILGDRTSLNNKENAKHPVNNTLAELIRSIDIHINSADTKRANHRDSIIQVASELRNTPADDEDEIKKGTAYLLGALFHRYFRIPNEPIYLYSFFNPYASPINSKLLLAIRAVLNLDKNVSADYQKKDLEVLDVQTIVSSLIMFKKNMMKLEEQKDGSKKPHYMKIPHFAQDTKFELHLDQIIETLVQEDLLVNANAPILNQFKAINFIVSLAKKISVGQQAVENALQDWSKVLRKDYPDFKQLTPKQIEAHVIKNIKSDFIRDEILYVLDSSYIHEAIIKHDHQSFLTDMIKADAEVSQTAEEHRQVVKTLQNLSESLTQKEPDFSKLDSKTIESHFIITIKSPVIKNKILSLLNRPKMQLKLTQFDHNSFLDIMKKGHASLESNTVVGAFVLILQSEGIHPDLRYCLNEALGIEKNPKAITLAEMHKDVEYLEQFLAPYLEKEVKEEVGKKAFGDDFFDFFGGKGGLSQKIIKTKQDLADKMQKPQPQEPLQRSASSNTAGADTTLSEPSVRTL